VLKKRDDGPANVEGCLEAIGLTQKKSVWRIRLGERIAKKEKKPKVQGLRREMPKGATNRRKKESEAGYKAAVQLTGEEGHG